MDKLQARIVIYPESQQSSKHGNRGREGFTWRIELLLGRRNDVDVVSLWRYATAKSARIAAERWCKRLSLLAVTPPGKEE